MSLVGIQLEEAIEILKNESRVVEDTIDIDILDSYGYIVAKDIIAPIDNPPFNRSPLDGFALDSRLTIGAEKKNPLIVDVRREVMAGEYIDGLLENEGAIRIMTGAPIPSGLDCVIKQEEVEFCQNSMVLKVYRELEKHENFVFQGEDFETGELLIKKGEKLGVNHIGVLASLGLDSLRVYRKIKVGILCTGDEIVLPGKLLEKGKIYNSNLYAIISRLKTLGVEVESYGQASDNKDKIIDIIDNNIDNIDLLITTGGVSVGKKDIIHDVIEGLPSKRIFWKLDMKPGTPIIASKYRKKLILSLSGNPFAAIVNFEVVVKPILNIVSRGAVEDNIKKDAILVGGYSKESNKRRFLRARYHNGRVYIDNKKHSSGQLASMIGKNALIDIPKGSKPLVDGDRVEVIYLGME